MENIPDTLGQKVQRRLDSVIGFLKEQEKRVNNSMERIVIIARDKLEGANLKSNDELAQLVTSRLSILGDKQAIKIQLLNAAKKYSQYLIVDLVENENSENKVISKSPAFQKYLEAINKILE